MHDHRQAALRLAASRAPQRPSQLRWGPHRDTAAIDDGLPKGHRHKLDD